MTESQMEKWFASLMWITFMGFVACCFFWVNACQRTEIIKACLQYVAEKKADCVKDAP